MPESIPVFSLYGEPPCDDVEEQYLHIESIAERSRVHDWTILPHLHRDLHHLLLVTHGHGVLRSEQRRCPFESWSLIRVPNNYVHGFEFAPGTNGWVITVSDSFLQRIAQEEQAELNPLTRDAKIVSLSRQSTLGRRLQQAFYEVVHEFRGAALARRTAIRSSLLMILVTALRLEGTLAKPQVLVNSGDALLIARFQGLLELHFKSPLTIEEYAAKLAVSRERLRLACKRITDHSPVQLLLRRRLLEAKRSLLYTNMTVGQIANYCGFGDPAYFSRQFQRIAGEKPSTFRARRTRDANH